MTDWKWDYNPSEEYLTAGLPVGVVAEVERIATELAALSHDAEMAGSRPEDKPGGLRNFPIFGDATSSSFSPFHGTSALYLQRCVARVTTPWP